MNFSKEVEDIYGKCMAAIDLDEDQINFIDECRKTKDGELRSYPLDDIMIQTFRITKQELARYTTPRYAEHGCWAILEDILLERLAKVEGCKRTSLFGEA
ncbi:MAG: hypothetical protein FWG36_06815 [Oscillospiraceae bacterium]|nr:hypothetical protein [Oscillospiraceae bacterium]